MKVEFDIKYRPQIESGEYQVETNNGRKVRIICWDAVAPDREQDIIALVINSYGDSENILRYYNNGKLISDSASVGEKDLCVIIPVKCNVGDWIKYNGNVYAITSIDNYGYKVALLDGDEDGACTAISFTAADNMARLVEKPEFSYFQESLAHSLNCEFMGVTLDECEYFAAKYGKELEDAILKEHPVPEPEKEAEKKWIPKFKVGDLFIYNGMCQEANIYKVKRVVQDECVSGYWCGRFDVPTMSHAWFSSSEEKYMEPEPEQEWGGVKINGNPIPTENQVVDISLVEWSEEDETRLKVIKEELERYIMLNQYGTPLSVDDIDWLKSLPERLNLQPKQEWSEEDKSILDNIVAYKVLNIDDLEWLKSLPERLNLQPKQEWSEEDEHNLQWIISCVKGTNIYTSQELAKELTEWLKNKLKVPHPQPKQEWSEEDEAHRAFILESLEDQIRFCKKDAEGACYAKQIRAAQNWFKALRPQHQWKPSKEQMEALYNVEFKNFKKFGPILESLYNDLKNNYDEN